MFGAGIRLLGPMGMTDMQEAEAIAHNSDIIEVYSNSWGVPDSGRAVGGPGPLFQRALETGVREVGLDGVIACCLLES